MRNRGTFKSVLFGSVALAVGALPVAAGAPGAGVGVLPCPHDPDIEFEDSLEQLLERLTKLRTEGTSRPDRTARRVRARPGRSRPPTCPSTCPPAAAPTPRRAWWTCRRSGSSPSRRSPRSCACHG